MPRHCNYLITNSGIYSPIASETLKCFEEAICSKAICSKEMQEGRRSSPLGPHKAKQKCLVEELFSSKQLVFSWLKFLCEALGCSSHRTKLRASSMHNVEASIDAFGTVRCTSCNTHFNITSSPSGLHGLTNKIGSSTRSASSMHRGVRGDFLNR